jgi:hypothetical protein
MALNRELNTAGVFILGQSHHFNYNAIKSRKFSFGEADQSTASPGSGSSTTATNTAARTSQRQRQPPAPPTTPSSSSSLTPWYNSGGATVEYYAQDAYDAYAAETNGPAGGGDGDLAYRDQLGRDGGGGGGEEFDMTAAFIGRLFNFNVWYAERNATDVLELFADCKLLQCGDAAQWSDYRQGTRGNVVMKWPTELLWRRSSNDKNNDNSCFSERFQFDSCNRHCNRMIGPICRESVERNVRWPLTKANVTHIHKCFPHLAVSSRYAYRYCSLVEPSVTSPSLGDQQHAAHGAWHTANVDECVQEALLELKNDAYAFHTTDNFDETLIIGFLDRLYDLSIKHVKLLNAERSIFDVSTLIDTMFYLVNAQVRNFLY